MKTCAISALGLILLFCVLTYVTAPHNDGFELNSINPLGFMEGFLFTLGFGVGMPVWLSVVVLGMISFFVFMVLLWIARKIIK